MVSITGQRERLIHLTCASTHIHALVKQGGGLYACSTMFSTLLPGTAMFVGLGPTSNPTWNSGKNSKRRMFLIELGNALSKPHILRRYKNPKMQLSVKNRIKSVGLAKDTDLQQVEVQQPSEQQSKGRCHLCDVRKESRTRCSGCSQFTCPEHKKIICNQCVLKLI